MAIFVIAGGALIMSDRGIPDFGPDRSSAAEISAAPGLPPVGQTLPCPGQTVNSMFETTTLVPGLKEADLAAYALKDIRQSGSAPSSLAKRSSLQAIPDLREDGVRRIWFADRDAHLQAVFTYEQHGGSYYPTSSQECL